MNSDTREIWKDYTPYHQDFVIEVSNLGRIRFVGKILPIIKQPDGHKVLIEGKRWYVHKLVAQAFLGIQSKDYKVVHKNGNIFDNNVENLEYQFIHNKDTLGYQGNNYVRRSIFDDDPPKIGSEPEIEEVWKLVNLNSKENCVEVSNLGEVKVNDKILEAFLKDKAKTVKINGSEWKVWKFVAEAFFNEGYNHNVAYKDKNLMNCKITNLIFPDMTENGDDRVKYKNNVIKDDLPF